MRAGRLEAQNLGCDYAIDEAALTAVTTYGKPGRPKKAAEAGTVETARASAPMKAKPLTKKQAVKKGR
jgi:hypothetical protein